MVTKVEALGLALRQIGRPDAAQFLEEITREEWGELISEAGHPWLAGPWDSLRDNSNGRSPSEILSGAFAWDLCPQFDWAGLYAALLEREERCRDEVIRGRLG